MHDRNRNRRVFDRPTISGNSWEFVEINGRSKNHRFLLRLYIKLKLFSSELGTRPSGTARPSDFRKCVNVCMYVCKYVLHVCIFPCIEIHADSLNFLRFESKSINFTSWFSLKTSVNFILFLSSQFHSIPFKIIQIDNLFYPTVHVMSLKFIPKL